MKIRCVGEDGDVVPVVPTGETPKYWSATFEPYSDSPGSSCSVKRLSKSDLLRRGWTRTRRWLFFDPERWTPARVLDEVARYTPTKRRFRSGFRYLVVGDRVTPFPFSSAPPEAVEPGEVTDPYLCQVIQWHADSVAFEAKDSKRRADKAWATLRDTCHRYACEVLSMSRLKLFERLATDSLASDGRMPHPQRRMAFDAFKALVDAEVPAFELRVFTIHINDVEGQMLKQYPHAAQSIRTWFAGERARGIIDGFPARKAGFASRLPRMAFGKVSEDDPYIVLELEPGASPAAVKSAFRRLVSRHHPDKGGHPETFRRINAAYERLRVS